MPSVEGTPMLSIVVGEEERAEVDLGLDAILREGARRMLVAALRAEVDEYMSTHTWERDETGNALVVRNGVAQARQVKTAAGQLEVRAPRVNDRREGSSFISAILPPWARRSPKVAEGCRRSICGGSPPSASSPRWRSSLAARRGFRLRPSSA